MNRVGLTAVILGLTILTGCEKFKNTPVDMTGSPLVGAWYGEDSSTLPDAKLSARLLVHVSEDGYVDYHYLDCDTEQGQPGREKRLDLRHMPITRLNATKMVLQTYPLTLKFELTLGAWPDETGGVWTVDNIPLRNAAAVTFQSVTEWSCQ